MLDTSALTGESLPREVMVGSELLSGCINMSGLLKAEVTKPYSESTVNKILELVENASSRKSKSEKFITKFARYYLSLIHIFPYFEEADMVIVCRKLYTQDMKPESFIIKDLDNEFYPKKDYHTLYLSEIERIYIKK